MNRPDQKLTRARRLLSSRDFERAFKDAKLARHPVLWLYSIQTEGEDSRLGIIVGKTVGKATVRNRTKRRLREIFRINRPAIKGTFDIILRARPGINDVPTEELDRIFLRLISQVGIPRNKEDRHSRPRDDSNRAGETD